MNKTIYLIRHGDVENPEQLTYGRERDVMLSSLGRRRIEQLAKNIMKHSASLNAIISSPLKRAWQTSQIIAHIHGNIPVVKDDDLLETDSKNFVGRPLSWLRSLNDPYITEKKDYEIENPDSIRKRMKQAFINGIDTYPQSNIGFVSHGDPLAFGLDSLLHPTGPRSLSALRKEIYLSKSHAWRLELGSDMSVMDMKRIFPTS